MVFLVGVVAALLLGVGYVLQQRVAATAPLAELLRIELLLDLMHRPLWWAGIGCMVAGQVLSGLALQLASVSLVEPLLSTNLLFALGTATLLAGQRPRLTELGGAVLVSGALAAFIAIGDPHTSHETPPPAWAPFLAVAVIGVLVAGCTVVARRRQLVGESIWLATGAGILYGLQDAATRAGLLEFDRRGVVALVDHLWVYVVVASAALGILLSQSAFKAARLDCSLPPITVAEPVVGIALGIGLLGDTVSITVPGLAVESACLVVMVAGVVLVGRSPHLAGSGLGGDTAARPAGRRPRGSGTVGTGGGE